MLEHEKKIIRRLRDKDDKFIGYMFFCPGCKCGHAVWTEQNNELTGARWKFNGNEGAPTFEPSILVRGTEDITDEERAKIMRGEKITPRPFVCHSFVRDGKIQFLGDCTHSLANQTIPLEPF